MIQVLICSLALEVFLILLKIFKELLRLSLLLTLHLVSNILSYSIQPRLYACSEFGDQIVDLRCVSKLVLILRVH